MQTPMRVACEILIFYSHVDTTAENDYTNIYTLYIPQGLYTSLVYRKLKDFLQFQTISKFTKKSYVVYMYTISKSGFKSKTNPKGN